MGDAGQGIGGTYEVGRREARLQDARKLSSGFYAKTIDMFRWSLFLIQQPWSAE